jgi:LysM repeat protein
VGKHSRRRKFSGAVAAGVTFLALLGGSVAYALTTSPPQSHPAPVATFTELPPVKPAPKPSATPSAPPVQQATVKVSAGDTLTSISVTFCHTANYYALQKANHIANPNTLTIGQVLKLEC